MAINLFQTYLNTFKQEYKSISLVEYSFYQSFEDVTFNSIKLDLLPENEEGTLYKGSLQVEGLKFGLVSTLEGESERVEVELPQLLVYFNLFSSNGFLSIDDLIFDESNEPYQIHAQTLAQLFNMAIIKNLGKVYAILKGVDNFDEAQFKLHILEVFKQKYDSFYETKSENQEEEEQQQEQDQGQQQQSINSNEDEKRPFKFDVKKYLNKQNAPPPRKRIDQEITINSLEDLENLVIDLNVGRVAAAPNASDL